MNQTVAEPANLIRPSKGVHIPVMRWELCEFEVLILPAWESFYEKLKLYSDSGPTQIGPVNFPIASRWDDPDLAAQ